MFYIFLFPESSWYYISHIHHFQLSSYSYGIVVYSKWPAIYPYRINMEYVTWWSLLNKISRSTSIRLIQPHHTLLGARNIIKSWRWISYRMKLFGFLELASNSEFGLLFGKHRPLYSSARVARLYTILVQSMREKFYIHSPMHWIAQFNISEELFLYIRSNSNDIETLQRLNYENGDASCTLTGAGRYRLPTQPHSFIHVMSG